MHYEKENLEGGIKLIPRPTDVSPVGPFFLTESRSAAIEWAKKISNGLFGGDNPRSRRGRVPWYMS